MRHRWLTLACLLGGGASLIGQVSWREISLPIEGKLLSTEVVSQPGGRRELVLAVWNRELQRRELRLHPIGRDTVALEPRLAINVLDDIVAWGLGDLEPDRPGRELLLLTPGAAWSYRPEPGGYALNASKLFEFELLYDLPDRDSLPRWPYVIPSAEGAQLLLPSATGYSCFATRPVSDTTAPDGDAREWVETARISVAAAAETSDDDGETSIRIGSGGVDVRNGSARSVDLGDELASFLPLLTAARSFRAPGLVDMDADGRLDLVRRGGGELMLHGHRESGYLATPDSSQTFPDALRDADVDRDLLLRDVDGDGDSDLVGLLEEKSKSVLRSNHKLSLLVYLNDGTGILSRKPDQVLRFEGVSIKADVADVDGDGVLDLLVDTFSAPDLTELRSPDEIKATLRMLVFRGRGKGRFERDPLFSYTQSYDADSIDQAVLLRSLDADCTGDGIPDLVTADVSGRVGVRPVKKESSFFGGSSWKVARTPEVWLKGVGVPQTMLVEDLNADGVADILMTYAERVTIFLTERRR